MNHSDIKNLEDQLLQVRGKSNKQVEIESLEIKDSPQKIEISVPIPAWNSIIDLVIFILQFARKNALNEDGTPRRFKWYDFLFKKELRHFVGKVISTILDFFSSKF